MTILIGGSLLLLTIFILPLAYSSDVPSECNGSFLAHPYDCNKFYMCSSGQPYLMTCPVGLHWNVQLNTCDWEASANCAPNNQPNSQSNHMENVEHHANNDNNYQQHDHDHSSLLATETDPNEVLTPNESEQSGSKCASQMKSVCYCEYKPGADLHECPIFRQGFCCSFTRVS